MYIVYELGEYMGLGGRCWWVYGSLYILKAETQINAISGISEMISCHNLPDNVSLPACDRLLIKCPAYCAFKSAAPSSTEWNQSSIRILMHSGYSVQYSFVQSKSRVPQSGRNGQVAYLYASNHNSSLLKKQYHCCVQFLILVSWELSNLKATSKLFKLNVISLIRVEVYNKFLT